MITSHSVIAPKLEDPNANIKRRLASALETFPLLPDEALIDIRVVCALRSRSRASIWRDVSRGYLAPPVKVGHSTRWRVGDVRAALASALVTKTAA
jgi:predicted DNA-binding transcriptional regulator AlpA